MFPTSQAASIGFDLTPVMLAGMTGSLFIFTNVTPLLLQCQNCIQGYKPNDETYLLQQGKCEQ